MSRPCYRAAWTLIDKVLNRSLDYDARILSPESFSKFASRLDQVVRETFIKVASVVGISRDEEHCLRLSIDRGGCGITSALRRGQFAHLSAACQFMPAVGQIWLDSGWHREEIESAVDFSGVHHCLRVLRGQGIFLNSDGSIHPVQQEHSMNARLILWGQARKMHNPILTSSI